MSGFHLSMKAAGLSREELLAVWPTCTGCEQTLNGAVESDTDGLLWHPDCLARRKAEREARRAVPKIDLWHEEVPA